MKKKMVIIAFLFVLLAASLTYAQLAMSPGCYAVNKKGKCVPMNVTENKPINLSFRVYNRAESANNFTLFIEPEYYKQFVNLSERKFSLQPHNDGNCDKSPGCKEFYVTVNIPEMEDGMHSFYVAAQTIQEGGALSLHLQVKSRVALDVDRGSSGMLLLGLLLGIMILAIAYMIYNPKADEKSNKSGFKPKDKPEKKKSREKK